MITTLCEFFLSKNPIKFSQICMFVYNLYVTIAKITNKSIMDAYTLNYKQRVFFHDETWITSNWNFEVRYPIKICSVKNLMGTNRLRWRSYCNASIRMWQNNVDSKWNYITDHTFENVNKHSNESTGILEREKTLQMFNSARWTHPFDINLTNKVRWCLDDICDLS